MEYPTAAEMRELDRSKERAGELNAELEAENDECEECEGAGKWNDYGGNTVPCPTCEGTGKRRSAGA